MAKNPPSTSALRKKSVSKAPADKGRADSRAVNLKRQKNARISNLRQNPADLEEMYAARREEASQPKRKVTRTEKHKK